MIDDKDAIDALNKTSKKGEETSGKLSKMAGVGLKAGAAVGAGAVAGGAALFGMANKAAGTTDRIDKLSQKIGFSRKGFQEWEFITSQSGMSIETLQGGMKTMVNRMDEAIAGTGKGADAFKALGISAVDSSGQVKTQEQVFEEAVVALQGMKDGAEKAQIANELFGRSGSEMAPLLNGAVGSIDDMKNKAGELGLVLSDEAVNSGVLFTDTMDQTKRMLGAVTTQIGVGVMPMFQTFMEWVMEHMPAIKEVMGTVFGAIEWVVTNVVTVFREHLLPIIMTVVGWIKENMPAIKETVSNVFEGVKTVWEETLKPAFEAILGLVRTVWDLFLLAWPSIKLALTTAFDAMKLAWNTVLKPTFDFVIDLVNKLKEKFDEQMPKIEQFFKGMSDSIEWAWTNVLKPAIEAAGEIVQWLFDQFNEYIWPLVSDVIDWFGEMTAGMDEKMSWIRDQIDAAILKITGFFDGIKQAKDDVLGWFGEIKDGISEKINGARDAIDLAIQKIKGFFEFEFKWPTLKMPKFGITPDGWRIDDLLKGSIPKLSLNWNAAGGIFDEPTIFGTSAGLQGVGEAGPEAIMPLSKLQTMLDWNSDKVLLQEMVNLLKDIKSKNNVIALDGDKLVGGVYDRIDEMVAFKQRENELAYGG